MQWTKPSDETSHPSTSESLYEKSLVEKWVYWIFVHFLIPILQHNFYITERAGHKNRIFYYRRSVWAKIRKLAIGEMKSTIFEVLPESEALKILKQRAFGFSYIRIVPKVSDINLLYFF